jgi:hypothetical protein
MSRVVRKTPSASNKRSPFMTVDNYQLSNGRSSAFPAKNVNATTISGKPIELFSFGILTRMISRKSTTAIAHIYALLAIEDGSSMYAKTWTLESLCELFYDEDYPEWFIKRLKEIDGPTELREFIQGLQTGTSVKNSFVRFAGNPIEAGQDILKKLAINIFSLELNENHEDIDTIKTIASALSRQLELDGYVYKNNRLYPADSSVIDEKEEQSYLEELIDNATLNDKLVIKHHLELAERAYVEARWSDAISNARNFFEAILEQVAGELHHKINGAALTTNRPVEIREYLDRAGFVDRTEKEAIAKVYGLISNTGSHPNMAHKDQARLMRNLALTFSQYILMQWAGFLANNP